MNLQPGQNTQTAGNPVLPGTLVSGPLLAGNIQSSDGTTNLAGVGALAGGISNVGYSLMAQTDVVTQLASTGATAGVFLSTQLVIPAQSLILFVRGRVTTGWSGASKTFGLGWKTSSATTAASLTAAGAADGTAVGPIDFSPGADATRNANWNNVGLSDVQIQVTSTNTGNGVMTLTVVYLQAVNSAS